MGHYQFGSYSQIVHTIQGTNAAVPLRRSLVFVRGSVWPHYARAFTFNPPTFDRQGTSTIYVRDLGPDSNERLRAYYADRPVWVLGGSEGMFEELRVIAGPLPPQSAAAQEGSR
jgi:hypothetical protein